MVDAFFHSHELLSLSFQGFSYHGKDFDYEGPRHGKALLHQLTLWNKERQWRSNNYFPTSALYRNLASSHL